MTGTEVGQAEGWACGGSHALVVALSAPRLTQSWPVPSPHGGPGPGEQREQEEGVCFLFVGDACKSSGQRNNNKKQKKTPEKPQKATNTKGEEARWM